MTPSHRLMSTRYASAGAPDMTLTAEDCRKLIRKTLDQLRPLTRVLIVPPDFTRFHSMAGELTVLSVQELGDDVHYDIMPALGTHRPMTPDELAQMYPGIPADKFKVHDWRNDVVDLGRIPGEYLKEISEGRVDYPINVEINKILLEGNYDLVLSIGQIVPHEVAGMANQNKNIFVGLGGSDTINRSHFLGAAYNMERIMGRIDTPVRAVLDKCSAILADKEVHVVYMLTVRSPGDDGKLVTRGLYIGDDRDTYRDAARLSQQVNLDLLDEPISKAIVYLQPDEFQSTWLGNKAVYRLRMAMADDGELIVIAPGLKTFGEDPEIDRLIRKFGYRGTPATLQSVKDSPELGQNLSAAAHLIHGSSEGRFTITYCPGAGVTEDEIRSVNFEYGDLDAMTAKYNIGSLKDGYNTVNGEKVFYVSNPALGLWALTSDFPTDAK